MSHDTLPKSVLTKVISDALPPNMKCSPEARDLIALCCNEMIDLITSEATEISDKAKKKTIMPDHVFQALEALEMKDYAEPLKAALATAKSSHKAKPRNTNKLKKSGKTMEELQAAQERLFQKNAAALQARHHQEEEEEEEDEDMAD